MSKFEDVRKDIMEILISENLTEEGLVEIVAAGRLSQACLRDLYDFFLKEHGYKCELQGENRLIVYWFKEEQDELAVQNDWPSQRQVDFEGRESVGIQDSDDLTVKQSSSEKRDDKE